MNKKELIEKLRKLYNIPEVKKGFPSRDDCLKWANEVAPLLKFNTDLYVNFRANAHKFNFNLSPYTTETTFRIMISQLEQGISELENEIKYNKNNPNKTQVKSEKLKYPEKVTLSWLFKNVPIKFWLGIISILIAVGTIGYKVGTFVESQRSKFDLPKQISVEPTKNDKKNISYDKEKVLKITPEEVLEIVSKGETNLEQVEIIKERFSDKFVEWEITVEELVSRDDGTAGIWGSNILANFDSPDDLYILSKGLKAVIAGIISSAGDGVIVLQNCKIIKIK